jgi:FtsH-binding integral membrane protein
MDVPKIDEPVRLGSAFWITLGLSEAAFVWYFRPWNWDYPVWYRIVSAVLFPFLAAMLIYCVTMFFVSIIMDFRSQLQTTALFVFAIVVGGIVFAFAWVKAGFRDVPAAATFVASFVANALFTYLRHRRVVDRSRATLSNDELKS